MDIKFILKHQIITIINVLRKNMIWTDIFIELYRFNVSIAFFMNGLIIFTRIKLFLNCLYIFKYTIFMVLLNKYMMCR